MWAALITSKIRLTSEVTSAQDPYRCLWEMQLFLLFLCYFLVSGLFFSYCSTFSVVPFSTPSLPPAFSKTIKVKIIDDEEYEKNKTFYVELGEPRLVEGSDNKVQEEGEHLWMLNPPPSVRHTAEAACFQQQHTGGDFFLEKSSLSSRCSPPDVFRQRTCSKLWATSSHCIHDSTFCVCVCVWVCLRAHLQY